MAAVEGSIGGRDQGTVLVSIGGPKSGTFEDLLTLSALAGLKSAASAPVCREPIQFLWAFLGGFFKALGFSAQHIIKQCRGKLQCSMPHNVLEYRRREAPAPLPMPETDPLNHVE